MANDVSRQRKRQRRKRRKQLQHALQRRQTRPPVAEPTRPDDDTAEQKHPGQIQEKDITGLKYFDKLAPLLERLHEVGCERDKAGNRELHFDQYALLILLYLFNPIVTSLRGIQQASELNKVQKKLGCSRASLGSLSEAASVFDAERLKEIIAELGADLKPLGRDLRLQDIDQTLTLVDGTLIAARRAGLSFARRTSQGRLKSMALCRGVERRIRQLGALSLFNTRLARTTHKIVREESTAAIAGSP